MNMTQLQHFQAIYQYRNMTRAADQLYITQQGLSRSIKSLEKELEAPLFIRTSSGVIPTPYAEAIIDQADDILELHQSMEKRLAHMKQTGESALVIDCNQMILDSFPHGTQEKLEKDLFPNVTFTYHETDEATAMEHLLTGETDLAHISAPADEEQFRIFRLKTYPVMAVVPLSHPLSREKHLVLEDVDGVDVISFSPKYNIYHHFVTQCDKKGIAPHIVFEVSDALHMYFLCKENEGVGICPAFYCDYLPQTDVRLIPFVPEQLSWSISITVKQGKKLSPLLQSYIKAFETLSRQQ